MPHLITREGVVTRTILFSTALAVAAFTTSEAFAQQSGGMVQVSPSSTTATGAVVIHSPLAGEVITQNLGLPNPPREHRGRVLDGGSTTLNLPPGQYKVGVEYDAGGSDYREVRVDPAFRAEVTLETWTTARNGAHFGFMVYGTATDVFASGDFIFGPVGRGFVNIAGTNTFDIQFGGQIGARFGAVPTSVVEPLIEASLTADLVWNTRGGIYRPYVGGRIGGWFGDYQVCSGLTLDPNCTTTVEGSVQPVFALEASLLHFSLGSRRNFDIDFGQDLSFMVDTLGEEDTKIFLGLNLGVGAVFY